MIATEQLYAWVRIGLGGSWQRFDDLQLTIEYLNLHSVGRAEAWIKRGFCTPNYWGTDYIHLYWGDEDARLKSLLLGYERDYIADRLDENYL